MEGLVPRRSEGRIELLQDKRSCMHGKQRVLGVNIGPSLDVCFPPQPKCIAIAELTHGWVARLFCSFVDDLLFCNWFGIDVSILVISLYCRFLFYLLFFCLFHYIYYHYSLHFCLPIHSIYSQCVYMYTCLTCLHFHSFMTLSISSLPFVSSTI